MSEPTRGPVEVHVAGADQQEAARLLLKAAEDTGHPVDSVATIGGGFLVPYEVAVAAGAVDRDGDGDGEPDPGELTMTPATEAQAETHPEVTGEDGPEVVLPLSEAAGQEQTDEGDQVLRGEALEQALRDRGLSLSGTADEKRARVAEYDAAQASSPSAE